MLGQTTSLTGEAKIDVSGETGGTVLVGGDYQGKNPDILNADYNFVDPQVTIKADSLGQGSGGKVIFWSNKATHFYRQHLSPRRTFGRRRRFCRSLRRLSRLPGHDQPAVPFRQDRNLAARSYYRHHWYRRYRYI